MSGANPMRGEVAIGDHKLVVDFNSICALEEATGRKAMELAADMQFGLGFSDIRLWFKVLLDKDMTLNEVGDLLSEVGPTTALEALARGFELCFPVSKEKKKNPRKAA